MPIDTRVGRGSEEVIRQHAWLRRLAGSLVGRGALAEDLTQETLLTALRARPAPDVPLKPWLGGVLRNILRHHLRTEARRLRRERLAAEQVGPTPTPETITQEGDIGALLSELVDELTEPYRSTLVLRYYHELSCAEIARQRGLRPGTVRGQLKRGMDQLRARIDERYQGDRKRWLGALAAYARREPPPVWKWIAGVAAVAGVGAWSWLAVGAPPRAAVRAVAAAAAATRPTAHAAAFGFASARAVLRAAPRRRESIPARVGPEDVPDRRVAGRVTFDGRPVADAEVSTVSALTEAGLRAPPHARTDASGRFDLGVLPPLGTVVFASAPERSAALVLVNLGDPTGSPSPDRLELALGDCARRLHGTVGDASGGPIARARVRWHDASDQPGAFAVADERGRYEMCLPPGPSQLDVSASGYAAVWAQIDADAPSRRDFALVPEAVVEGRVVRGDGETAVGGAAVYVWIDDSDPTLAPVSTATDELGRFHLGGLAGARYRVLARGGDGSFPSDPIEIETTAGQVVSNLVLRIDSGVRLKGVVVERGVPVVGAKVLVRGRDSGRENLYVSQSDGRFVVDDAPIGGLELEVFGYELASPREIDAASAAEQLVRLEVTR